MIKGEIIYANIWGAQKKVILTKWAEIRKLGIFEVRNRAFGTLNDGTKALFFGHYEEEKKEYTWYVTTETLEEIYMIEKQNLNEFE